LSGCSTVLDKRIANGKKYQEEKCAIIEVLSESHEKLRRKRGRRGNA
jgi:uncharacterized protein YceK